MRFIQRIVNLTRLNVQFPEYASAISRLAASLDAFFEQPVTKNTLPFLPSAIRYPPLALG